MRKSRQISQADAESTSQDESIAAAESSLAEREAELKKEESLQKKEESIAKRESEIEAKEKAQSSEITSESSTINTENNTPTAADFDQLPLSLKAHLAATAIDGRAMNNYELKGYYVFYNVEGNNFLVQVHSGAGSGHPLCLIKIDSETLTAISGVVYDKYITFEDSQEYPLQINKADLYALYLEHQQSFDIGQNNVEHMPDYTMAHYEALRSKTQQNVTRAIS